MYNRHKFVTVMAAGMALGAAIGVFTQSKQAKAMGRKFSKTPVGRTIKHLGTMINEMM